MRVKEATDSLLLVKVRDDKILIVVQRNFENRRVGSGLSAGAISDGGWGVAWTGLTETDGEGVLAI